MPPAASDDVALVRLGGSGRAGRHREFELEGSQVSYVHRRAFTDGPFPIWAWWDYKNEIPAITRACYQSWLIHAPTPLFEIRLVNDSNIHDWLPDLPPESYRMPYPSATSDLIRAGLLAKHGGLYLDTDILLKESLLRVTELLESSDVVAYTIDGQDCQTGSFSSNFLAGIKGNRLSKTWYTEAKQQLTRRCPLPQEQDLDNRQGVCCYHPNGTARQCHVNWAGLGEVIGHPVLRSILRDENPKMWESLMQQRVKEGRGTFEKQQYFDGPLADALGIFRMACFDEHRRHEGFASCNSQCLSLALRHGQLPASDVGGEGLSDRAAHHLFRSNLAANLSELSYSELINGDFVASELIRRALGIRNSTRI
eukprot:gnl/TRDRNA2_/TRDRNA2_68158_c0_seq1.p1 gnl/TRDRNA2_/TRDRNA2_68158_c0~~gnl/TRDRNA2_/TRDRNA2_68158_c0_seq1.p1  ORF type:complete len:421 (-),score=34.39 gnl/TRDRNA2_/TRDRNA2_68158_c0_seq1:127-1227(-)